MKLKSKKIGCFSDIHLGLSQNSSQWHQIALEFAKRASRRYLELGIDEIIIPGDIFHNRSEVSVDTLSVAKKFFDYFKDFTIYMSTGNHDCYHKDNSSINSISIFDGWDNIHVIDDKVLLLDTNFNKKVAIVPWGIGIEEMPKCDIMFAHLEINTFYMNPIKACDHGMESRNLFEKTKYVISGHFHKRDHRVYENGEILYLGSPYQQNFGDTKDDRGYYVFDLETNKFEFIENDFSPKFYYINENSVIKEDIVKNNIVSLIISDKDDETKLASLQAKLAAFSPFMVRVDYNEPSTSITTDDTDKDYDNNDLWENIVEYIQTLDIENKKEVENRLKDIYNKFI